MSVARYAMVATCAAAIGAAAFAFATRPLCMDPQWDLPVMVYLKAWDEGWSAATLQAIGMVDPAGKRIRWGGVAKDVNPDAVHLPIPAIVVAEGWNGEQSETTISACRIRRALVRVRPHTPPEMRAFELARELRAVLDQPFRDETQDEGPGWERP